MKIEIDFKKTEKTYESSINIDADLLVYDVVQVLSSVAEGLRIAVKEYYDKHPDGKDSLKLTLKDLK